MFSIKIDNLLNNKVVMVDVEGELSENQVLLFIIPSMDYNAAIIDIAKQLSGKSICYITLSKPFDLLKKNFSKEGIDVKNIVFVDGVSKTIRDVSKETGNCYFVSSPASLTELSLMMGEIVRQNFEIIVFDSITSILIYQQKAPVSKFLSTIVAKIKSSNAKAIFYALSMEGEEALIREASMFVDKVIDLEK